MTMSPATLPLTVVRSPSCRVPALIVVVPEKVLVASRVNLPAPSLVNVPVVVPITLAIVVSPAPPTVRPKPAPVIVPRFDSVSAPASVLIRALPARVIKPPKPVVPDRLRRAPVLPTPVPLRLSASAPIDRLLCSCRAALLATVVPPVVEPSAEAFWIFNTPAETVVVPL